MLENQRDPWGFGVGRDYHHSPSTLRTRLLAPSLCIPAASEPYEADALVWAVGVGVKPVVVAWGL